ncbi:MAG: efflux RND transporter periplasmic adaptor subunit [Calditrichia bacterium]
MKSNIFFHFLMIVIAAGCSDSRQSQETASPEAPAATAVNIVLAKEAAIAETIRLNGRIIPQTELEIFSRVPGLVVKEYTSEGARVNDGDVLAEIQQDIPGMEYSSQKVKATGSGIISRDAVESGSRVTPQQPLYTISNISKVYLLAGLMEKYIGQIKTGQIAAVRAGAVDKLLKGRITDILPVLDPVTRMAQIKIQIENKDHRLLPGMSGTAILEVGSHTGILLPLDAVINRGAEKYVYLITRRQAREKRIETGIFMDNRVEALQGISAGDSVIVLGQTLLEPGAQVRVAEEMIYEDR